MAAQKLSDLLPIDDANASPHAYEIFSLEAGEQDSAKIGKAVQATVDRLRSIKPDSEPAVWQKAAKLVQAARVTLADPEKKSALDARFGIISFDESPGETPARKSDPLAGMLPPINPMAPAAPVTPANLVAPSSPISAPNSIPAGMFGTAEATTTPVQPSATPSTPAAPAPLIRNTRPVQMRRRRGLMGSLMMATFMLGMVALIGALIYFLLFGPGAIAITSKDGEFIISTGPAPDSQSPQISDPRAIDESNVATKKPPRTLDPVMGEMAGSIDPPPPMPIAEATQLMVAPEPVEPTPDPAPPMALETPMEPEITDAMVSAADEAIARVSQTIRDAKWDQMKTEAESVTEMPMNPDQKAIADGLFHLADLAIYYRVGIGNGVQKTSAGDAIEVTAGVRISMVERGADFVVIRLDGRNRSYKFDELPPALANALAEFTIDAGPTRQAARAAYQAIVPNTNQGYREESIRIFGELDGQVQDADTTQMIAAIKHLYPATQ